MFSKQHTYHKTKPKLLQLILSMMFSLILLSSINTLSVQADYDGNKGGNTDWSDAGDKGIGASWDNSGILLYIAEDATGEPITGTVVVYNQAGNKYQIAAENSRMKFRSKLINGSTLDLTSKGMIMYQSSKLPNPILSQGGKWVSNGIAVKEYLLSAVDGKPVYQKFLEMAFGDNVLEEVLANPDEYDIVVQVVSVIHSPGTTKDWYLGTADGLAEFDTTGNNYIKNSMFNCMVTEEDHWGVKEAMSQSSGYHSVGADVYGTTGWGMHVINAGEGPRSGNQTTADESIVPTGQPHKAPNESTGTKTIIKNYRTYDLTNRTYEDNGCYIKESTDEHITIEQEDAYKVVGWKTSTTKTYPISSIPETGGWNPPGTIINYDDGPGYVVLNEPGEDVLYVLLERKISSTNTPADFKLSQSTISRKIQLSKPDGVGSLSSNITSLVFEWKRNTAHTTTCPTHTHTWGEDTYKTETSDTPWDDGGDPGTETHEPVYNEDGTIKEWKTVYKRQVKTGSKQSATHSCTWGEWKDSSVHFSAYNSLTGYATIVASGESKNLTSNTLIGNNGAWSKKETDSNTGVHSYKYSGLDYRCVIIRGSDKLTLAKWKNANYNVFTQNANSYLPTASGGLFKADNTPQGTRKSSNYSETFKVQFDNNSPDLSTTYGPKAACATVNNDPNSGMICANDTKTFTLKTVNKLEATVLVETYSGSPSTGKTDPGYTPGNTAYGVFGGISSLNGKTNVLGVEVPRTSPLTFRPYIQMNYDVYGDNHVAYGIENPSARPAFVLGQYERQITLNDYAEVSWKQRDWDKPNLTLSSLQWSTHARASDFIGNDTTENGKTGLKADIKLYHVLPGGATLDLQVIKDAHTDDRQRVSVTTYQPIIEGTGAAQLTATGYSLTGYTEADAIAAHKDYLRSVMEGIEGVGFEQWAGKANGTNLNTLRSGLGRDSGNVWNLSGSGVVTHGSSLSPVGNSGNASTESKYYLSSTDTLKVPKNSSGDFDVDGIYNNYTTMKKYTFFINTRGEIRMMDSSTENEHDERAGQQLDPANLSGIAKQINDRTHIVDKLYAAVQTKGGYDASGRSKTTFEWYNEAMDGITYMVISSEVYVGLSNADYTGQIETVEDPKLTGESTGQSDLFNPEKYNVSQYRTKDSSTVYGTPGVIGKFKGVEVQIKDLNFLFFSRQWFIPNMTVQDLN